MSEETKALSLESITPTEVQLATVVDGAKDAIEKFNPDDPTSVDLFKSRKKELQQSRLTVKEACKAARDEANAFAKKVINHEKKLLEIITPTEDKMKEMLDEIKQKEIREERMKELPERINMIREVLAEEPINDEALLDMDHDQFIFYLNDIKARAFEKMQEAERARQAEERRQKELEEAREQARIEAEEKVKREAEEKINTERRAKEEAERKLLEEKERIAREEEYARQEAERKKREDEERKKKDAQNKAYIQWLNKHGVVEGEKRDDLIFNRNGNVTTLYKLVDTFTFED